MIYLHSLNDWSLCLTDIAIYKSEQKAAFIWFRKGEYVTQETKCPELKPEIVLILPSQ